MANILPKPRFWKKKVVLLKAEAQYSVDPTPTGPANWFEARNVSLTSFDATTVDRGIEMPYMGNGGKLIVSIWSKLQFDIAIAPSGSPGVAPKWGAMMLAGGFAETILATTSTTYNLVSDNIGSVCAYLNIDGTTHKFVGARCELKGKMTAKGIPLLSVELDSLYTAPITEEPPTIDRTGWKVEEAVNAVNTGPLIVDGLPMAFSELNWAAGNQLNRVDLPGPQREVELGDRKPSADCTVIAPALAVFNPYEIAASNESIVISNVHGTALGKKFKTELRATISAVAETNVEGALAYKLTLGVDPVLGNDEITLTCL